MKKRKIVSTGNQRMLKSGLLFEGKGFSFVPEMKKIPVTLCLLGVLLFSSCAEEDTADPLTDDREKFLGSWTCKETISGSVMTFSVFITSFGESDSVRISNFSNYGNTAVALGLVSGNSLTIPAQEIGITNIPVQGTGTYTNQGGNEKINLIYTSDGQSATAICTR
jgi:hypothetical protein